MNLSKQQLLQIIKEEIASITEDKREEEALAQLREPSDAALVVQRDRSGRSKDVVYEPRQDRKPRGRADFERELADKESRTGGHFTGSVSGRDFGATVRPPKELPFPDLESRLAGLRGESLTRLQLRQMVMEEIASLTEQHVPRPGPHTGEDVKPRHTKPKEEEGKTVKKEAIEEEKWIQGAEEDIEKRGTEGVCTGKKFGGPTCRAGTKRYNLAKTFRKMAKKRKKKE